MKRIINIFLKWLLPMYIRLWPSYYWLSFWSISVYGKDNIKILKNIRITTRKGINHEHLVYVIRKGKV